MIENPNILLVDDEAFNLELLEDILGDEGIGTVKASDGVSALEILEAAPHDFHAILLDRMMPRMNGLETLARIKEHKVLREIPVIFQTAMASESDILEGLQSGAHYYITKPFKKETLLAIVRTALTDFGFLVGLRGQLEQIESALVGMKFLQQSHYRIRTLADVYELVPLLAHTCPNPGKITLGILELLINAVEHQQFPPTKDVLVVLNCTILNSIT